MKKKNAGNHSNKQAVHDKMSDTAQGKLAKRENSAEQNGEDF